jgi:hypothetical protein
MMKRLNASSIASGIAAGIALRITAGVTAGVMALACVSGEATAQGGGAPPPVRIPVKAGQPGAPDLSKMPKSPKVPETFDELFAARDQRSQTAIGYFRCMQSTVNALRTGRLGKVPTEWSITCIEQNGEWRGVFGQLSESGIDVKLQVAYRGDRATVTSERVDTNRVNGTARALLRGLSAPHPGAGKYEFTPVPMWHSTFVEVWFLPVPADPTKAIVGGDSLIQMTADGGRELGHGRDTPRIRSTPVPLNASTWTLASPEERIPSVSELMLAWMALDIVPEVRIQTEQYESVLTRSAKRWTHHRR